MESRKNKFKKQFFEPNYSARKSYDLVIIGGGISGLTAGLMWLKNTDARKTLIIEKNYYTGGYIAAFERKGYVFEVPQLMGDVTGILYNLGVEIELRRYEDTYMRRLVVRGNEVDEYRLPLGPDNFADFLVTRFPSEEKKIRNFMKYILSLFSQVRTLKYSPKLSEKMLIVLTAPKVVACLNRTYSELLDKFGILNTKLREVLETFSVFSGVPPSRASCIQTTGAAITSLTNCYRPKGIFDELPIKMTNRYKELGGELLPKARVEKIVVEGGKVVGVRVEGDDEMIRAERVVTTIDPTVAMRYLVGEEHLSPAYVERLDNTLMSVSSFNVALGLDDKIDLTAVDMDNPYNVVSTELGTPEKLFDGFLEGDNAFSTDCFHVAAVCPSLTIGGPNTVVIRGVPFGINGWGDWKKNDLPRYMAEKTRWGNFFIDIVQKYFIPGLKNHIVVSNISTPFTYARYSGSPSGAIYDMASLVTQFGPRRLNLKTPIDNLFMPKFSHGIYGAMMGGVQVVDLMLGRAVNNGNSLFLPGDSR